MGGVIMYILSFEYHIQGILQGQRNFTTGQAKLDPEDYAIKCVSGQQLHEY